MGGGREATPRRCVNAPVVPTASAITAENTHTHTHTHTACRVRKRRLECLCRRQWPSLPHSGRSVARRSVRRHTSAPPPPSPPPSRVRFRQCLRRRPPQENRHRIKGDFLNRYRISQHTHTHTASANCPPPHTNTQAHTVKPRQGRGGAGSTTRCVPPTLTPTTLTLATCGSPCSRGNRRGSRAARPTAPPRKSRWRRGSPSSPCRAAAGASRRAPAAP